jgi:membrane protein implicated in regulation of membrane protease activity
MADSEVLVQWLGDRGFYAVLILALLVIGLLLVLARRHNARGGHTPTQKRDRSTKGKRGKSL